jgi:hypothetical protein
MNSALLARVSALLLGFLALPLGLVWAYWIALLVLPLSITGWLLLRFAEGRSPRHAAKPLERRLHVGAAVSLCLAFVASATMLVVIMASN